MRHRPDDPIAALAAQGCDAAEAWLERGLEAQLRGPAIFVASGATWPAALMWARLHEARGLPAWAATPYELCQRRGLPPGTRVVLISMSGANFDIVNAAEWLVEHASSGLALSAARESKMSATLAAIDAPTYLLERPPPDQRIAAPGHVIGLCTAAARVYGGANDWVAPFLLDSPTTLIERRPRRVYCLGAGMAAAAAADLCEKLVESGYALASRTDVRNFTHGATMILADAPRDALIVGFATGPERAYFEAFMAALPPELPRLLLSDPGEGIGAALALLARETHLFEAAARAIALEPTHADVPEWGRRLYFLDPKAPSSPRDQGSP